MKGNKRKRRIKLTEEKDIKDGEKMKQIKVKGKGNEGEHKKEGRKWERRKIKDRKEEVEESKGQDMDES